MRFIFFVCVCVLVGLLPAGNLAHAQSGKDGAAPLQKIITNQMKAFANGDSAKAFSFATRDLQRRFQTPDVFMKMVKQGYQPVYQPKNVSFGALKETKGGPIQEVYVVGPKGHDWLALYSFEQQLDGSWRISGCVLTKSPGLSA